MKNNNINLDELFSFDLSKLSSHVDISYLDKIKEEYKKELKEKNKIFSTDNLESFILFLFENIQKVKKEISQLILLYQDFKKQLSHISTDFEKEKIILEYALRLNPSRKELSKDKEAFKRWFNEDALQERIKTKIASLHRYILVCIQRIKSSILLFTNLNSKENCIAIWDNLELNRRFLQLVQYKHEVLVVHKSLEALVFIAKKLDMKNHYKLFDENLLHFIYRISLSQKVNTLLQNDAIKFLAYMKLSSFVSVANIRSLDFSMDDNIFVRQKIAKLALQNAHIDDSLIKLIKEIILYDTSSYVRQGLVKKLNIIKTEKLFFLKSYFLFQEKDKSVRALCILQLLEDFEDKSYYEDFRALIWEVFTKEEDFFVLKTTIYCIKKLVEKTLLEEKVDENFMEDAIFHLKEFIKSDANIALKRYASGVLEFVKIVSSPLLYKTYKDLKIFVSTINQGKSKDIPKEFLIIPKDDFYRILSIIALDDFSLELKENIFNGFTLYRGDRFERKIWRILHEYRNPSTDKRQAFLHTIGRAFDGTYYFPSAIMGEQAPTKVPGEPYFIPQEEGWRPYLPLMDHFTSILNQPTLKINPYNIYSSEGITTIESPKSFFKRLKAQFILIKDFAKIAKLRNWQDNSSKKPSQYIDYMRTLGFNITFNPYIKEDNSTNRFFSLGIPFLSLTLEEDISNYFVSAYENSLIDLAIFLSCIFGYFFIKHLYLSHKIKKARKKIPLSIGGWGTRGKSGTERLKAALFNSLGYRVFSKTTGNEAMFLHSESFDEMREMFLFRPYDKATIWEQANVVILAQKLKTDIFLWECMGLTPSYVDVLQNRWMNDDLSTITNTYPDHEDLQGPAGINIPQVMTNFIPKNSILITSEEIMYPILKTYANRVDTKTYQVGWLEAGLISSDILDRFPYEEHPFNIALVLRMAKELGLNEDNSLKAMADNIVPDLGVLKVYPPAKINARTLQFTNGMSANERFGALGNWKRMGFDIIDDEKEPNIFITVVINNRADRVSRSRVFASMLIEDVVADKYLLIGSNLSGFLNYLEESWENYKNKLSFDTNDKIIDLIAKFRIIRSSEQLISKLKIMLESCGINEELQKEIIENYNDLKKLEILLKDYSEIFKFYTLQKKEYDEFLDLKKIIDENSDIEKVTEFFQNQMWLWFKNRIVVVENYHAKGDEIVQIICDNTPIGMKNRVIGMQNIKGTGLDFAYRWVAWDKCYKICQDIKNGDGDIVKKALEQLAAFKEFGPLSFELAQESIDIGKKSVSTQSDYYQAQIQLIQTNLSSAKNRFLLLNNDNNDKIERSKWWYKILDIIEAFLDAGDAVKRRKKSNQIYEDLVAQRISHEKAALELQLIVKRQKGGWLRKDKM